MRNLENQESKLLKVMLDKNSKGKDRRWRERKLKSIDLSERLEILGYRSFERVHQCADVLKFREQADGTRKLYQAYFCKNKLCPMCNWRRSMKYSYQAERVITEAMKRQPKGRFLFLTLTVKNVFGSELNQTLSKMAEGFRRLMMYKRVDKNVIGYLRATEVTYSQDREDYHPHLHVLLFVKSSYFTGNSTNYLSQSDWASLWQKAMKLDYSPVVDIRAVKARGKLEEKSELKKAILETAKYPVKPFDLEKGETVMTETDKLRVTDDMVQGLHRKRQIGFGKLFKEIKKEFELDDLENGDLVKTGEDDSEISDGKEIIAVWNWERKNYFEK